MATKVNPPPSLRIPPTLAVNQDTRVYLEQVNRILFQLWQRTGGGTDAIADVEDSALYDVGIKGAEIAEITKALDDLRVQIAFLDSPAPEAEAATIGGDVEYDFGTTPVYEAQFTITDANISSTSVVLVTPGGAATGRTADDWRWDGASIGVVPGSGSATCYVTFSPGPIVGPRTFNYTVI